LPREGSLAEITPGDCQLIALKPAEDGHGWIARVQGTSGRRVKLGLAWLGQKLDLGWLGPYAIESFRLQRKGAIWNATLVNTQEDPVQREKATAEIAANISRV
jgi:alpha-mannosidase